MTYATRRDETEHAHTCISLLEDTKMSDEEFETVMSKRADRMRENQPFMSVGLLLRLIRAALRGETPSGPVPLVRR